jgi:hypothetical protein
MDAAPEVKQQESVYRRVSAEDFHGHRYQDEVLALRDGPYLEFPATISVETLSLCNAACDFCPYPGLERKGERMPDALIEKILNDISDIAIKPSFKFCLARVNEPFLDTRIFAISREIERRFPQASNFFFSNGSPLTEKNLLALAELQRVDYLNISVNDHRREEYERIMRLPFEHIRRRLDVLCKMKSSGVLRFPVYVSRVADGTPADQAFLDWVHAEYPALSGLVKVRGNWLGTIEGDLTAAPDAGCRQWFELHILTNGRAAFCCIDADGRHGAGDARHEHVIHEIYNHPARKHLRKQVDSRRQVNLCQTCPMLP